MTRGKSPKRVDPKFLWAAKWEKKLKVFLKTEGLYVRAAYVYERWVQQYPSFSDGEKAGHMLLGHLFGMYLPARTGKGCRGKLYKNVYSHEYVNENGISGVI